jgi:hypothetical protein
MARLLDDILAQNRMGCPFLIAPRNEDAWARHAVNTRRLLSEGQPQVILIDNVADYYFASDQEHWDLGRDFPNLAPPYRMAWFEHRIPRTIHSKECGDSDAGSLTNGGRVGLLVLAIDPADCACETGTSIPGNARWVLGMEIFIKYGVRDAVEGPHGSMFMAIDAEGKLIDRPWMQGYNDPEVNDIARALMTWTHPAMLATSFLHCKNVKVVDNPVDPKLAKRYRERHGGLAPSPYKTLIIEPLKQILRAQGRSGEVGLIKAMHICRGHFADYTEGPGLFGKYHGRYWIPSVVRGTKRKNEPMTRRDVEVRL